MGAGQSRHTNIGCSSGRDAGRVLAPAPTHRLGREREGIMYVYILSEPGLWTVGFYDPSGKWHADSDHTSREEAAERVHYLNGGK